MGENVKMAKPWLAAAIAAALVLGAALGYVARAVPSEATEGISSVAAAAEDARPQKEDARLPEHTEAFPPAGTSRAPGEEDRLKGRDFVRLGEFKALKGTLQRVRGEWILMVDGASYELHLGDHDHRVATGIRLEPEKIAEVTGFVYAQEGAEDIDVALCTVTLDGTEYRFRQDDGTPLWRGRSGGQGAGPGRGQGRQTQR